MNMHALPKDLTQIQPSSVCGLGQNRLALVPNHAPGPRGAGPRIHLTPRQREVLALLCEGLPNKLICRRLNISPGTVKAHISSILRELGVGTRLQAVVLARSAGLLEDDGTEGSGHLNGRR